MKFLNENNKGQLGILSLIFMFFIFIIFWAAAGGTLLKDAGESAIAEYGYTGFKAFVFSYMNVFVFIGLLLAIIVAIGIMGK